MEIQEKLDSIEQRRQEFLNQTLAEKNTQLIKETYNEYISAKEIKDFAPKQLDEAETNYFKARYGLDYIDKQKQKYKTESIHMIKDKLASHEKQLETLNESLNNYKNSETYAKSINAVKAMHLAKIKDLIQQIRLSDVHTNQQKAIFKGQEEDTIRWYIITFNCFIASFTVYFLLDNRQNMKKTTIIQVAFLISSIFLVKYLLYFIQKLFNYKLHFGYDPMKSKIPWVVYTFFILVAIWCWIYLDIFTLLSKRTFTPVTPPVNNTNGVPTTSIFAGITIPVAIAIVVLITVIAVLLFLLFI